MANDSPHFELTLCEIRPPNDSAEHFDRQSTVNHQRNGVHDGGFGLLGYLEGGWKPPGGTGWIRFTAFSTSGWQSRIYSYERDAPGNFTVPPCYGTGCSVMALAQWKRRVRKTNIKLYLRGSYRWQKEKPGVAGLKLQLTVDR